MSGSVHPLAEDFDDFFQSRLCGNMILDPQGVIVRSNGTLQAWLGQTPDGLADKRFSELLTIGGKIFHETHLAPLLRMQGHFDEVLLEMTRADGGRLPAFVNAVERRDETGELLFIRVTVFKATERQVYEQNLRSSKESAETSLLDERETAALREQFIAVLGHDLRNPLGAITMGTALLAASGLPPLEAKLIGVMESSAKRMSELIDNLMDFARFRLGGGVILNRKPVQLGGVLQRVVEELETAYPDRTIESEIRLTDTVDCDSARISQILSNLLANALTHGSQEHPVRVVCRAKDGELILEVINQGREIPNEILEGLFRPFVREEVRSSQNGLGLGLYIASEVAKAHGGQLSASSTQDATSFVFRMPCGSAVE